MATRIPNPYRHADPKVTYHLVTARRDRRCDDYPASAAGVIKAGDKYIVCTEFPGGESGYATAAGHPVRMSICLACIHPDMRALVDSLPATETKVALF